MNCALHWNTLPLPEWQERFNRLRRSNMLQSYEYGMAMRSFHGQTPRWGLIEINGVEAGLVQTLEVKMFWGMLHGLIIDRGPLWFEGFGKPDHLKTFLETLSAEYPARLGRTRRFIPECENTPQHKTLLSEQEWKLGKAKNYETLWMDLTKDSETLRTGLQKKWRNSLSKAERSNIKVEWDEMGIHLPWLLSEYQIDRINRRYPGPPVKLLKILAKQFAPQGKMLLGRALDGKEALSGILLFCHGQSATYQIGWTSDKGRKNNAHNLLLWQALERLQAKEIKDFDLGGINEDAEGIRKFKEGMGGDLVSLPGLYH